MAIRKRGSKYAVVKKLPGGKTRTVAVRKTKTSAKRAARRKG